MNSRERMAGAPKSHWLHLQEPLARVLVALVLVAACATPLAWPLLGLLGPDGGALQGAAAPLGTARIWALLFRSIGLSLAVTLGALLLGVPLGFLLGRTDVPGRRIAFLLHAFPVFIPPFFLGLGWFHILGRQGVLGGEWTARLLFSEAGLVAVLTLAFTPIVTSLVALGIWGLDASLEDAARVVAGPLRVAARILIPAAWPAAALGAMVVFALSFSELGVPMFLRVGVYPAAVFARLGSMDPRPGEAFLLTLPVLPIVFLLLILERRLLRGRSFECIGLRGRARIPLPLGPLRPWAGLAAWIVTVASIAPIASLTFRAARGGLGEVGRWIGSSLWNSLASSALAATLIVCLGIFLGHSLARRRPGSASLDALALFAFFCPAIVLGVGLVGIWNRPSTQILYGGMGIIVLGYLARYAVIGARTIAATVIQEPRHLEEAAAASGASYLRRLLRVVLPINWRGAAGAWTLAMVFCLRDLETPIVFYPPGREPLTVRIFTLEANGPEAVVAALALVQVVITGLVLCAGGALFLGGRRP